MIVIDFLFEWPGSRLLIGVSIAAAFLYACWVHERYIEPRGRL